MPKVAQVRRLTFNDEEIGMGFNSQSGLAVGTALEDFTVEENKVATGGEVTAGFSIISTHEELQSSLGMSFEAEGRYAFVQGSVKAKFSEQTNYNSASTFVVAQVVVENPLRRGKDFKVKGAAEDLLKSNQLEVFQTAFGDSFVRGLQTGGEFYAVIRITSVSTSTQMDLAASLQADYNSGFAHAKFTADFEKANKSASTKSEFTATMYQRAGAGPETSPTVTLDEVLTRYKDFPAIAARSASAYETEVATYDTLPLPLPTPVEQEVFLQALADARDKKLRFIQMRNDIEMAIGFQEFFEDPPSPQILSNAIVTYTRLLNAVSRHAVSLSKGEINPPQFFDASSLNPPLEEPQVVLVKKNNVIPVLPPNAMPNLVGKAAHPIIGLLACCNLESADWCISRSEGTWSDIYGDPKALADFFVLVTRNGVQPDVQGDSSQPGSTIRMQFPPPGTPVDRGTGMVLNVG